MTSDRWERLNDLFHRAEAVPESERAAFLEQTCADDPELRAEVEALLSVSRETSVPGLAAVQRSVERLADAEPAHSLVGKKIGAYRLTREIGRGGMGVVYYGRREDGDFAHEAAIKVLPGALLDGPARWRFQNERQILADLKHPGIARLIDGGETADGLPYVIMDFVDGVPIDEYCEQNTLDVQARIRLFLEVCEAVSHAHAHLVVHRDLKPANILVPRGGHPVLLDFGIAKLLQSDPSNPRTRPGVRALTPRYASPEQILGAPVGTVSDVYSLGVLLYELLAGTAPLRLDHDHPGALARAIETETPRRPSEASGRSELEGDLDTIILKALEKEPDRRYMSVSLFALDLKRHLRGHPVSARPPTLRYRAEKFVRRNTGGVVAAGLFVGLLIAFSTTVSLQARRIAAERDAAEQARTEATAVSDFLIDVFQANDPNNSRGVELTAGEILSRGGEQIRSSLSDQPDMRSEILETIGILYRGLGAYDSAQVFLDEALELRTDAFGTDDGRTTDTKHNLALVYEGQGDYERAEALLEAVLSEREWATGPESEGVAAALQELARFRLERGEADVAPLYERSLAIRRALDEPNQAEVLRTLHGLSALLRRDGQPDSAIVMLEQALDAQRDIYGDEHLTVASGINSLGAILYTNGRLDEAETRFREALAMRTRLVGENHPLVFTAMNNLALTLSEQGELDEAEGLYREIVRLRKERGDPASTYQRPLNNLGLLLSASGRPAEAVEAFQESIDARRASLGVRHPDVAFPLIGLASAQSALGEATAAEASYLEALSIRQEAFGPENRFVALDHYGYGRFLLREGRTEEAEAQIRRAAEIQRAVLEPRHVDLGETLTTLGAIALESDRKADARTLLEEAFEILRDKQSRALEDVESMLAELDADPSRPR